MITFSDNIERKPYLGSTEIAEVWLGNVKVYPDTNDYSKQYLTFDILQRGIIGYRMSTNTLQYSKNGGATWTNGSPNRNISVNAGDKVLVKFTNPVLYKENDTSTQTNGVCRFYTNCRFNLYGNIMSLIYGDDFNDNQKMSTLPVMQDNYGNTVNMNHFINLFYGCDKLISAENLVLPATILKDECYNGMFQNCSSLTTAPKILPAAYVTAFSYAHMFDGCTSLVNAPILLGMVMGRACYQYMFYGCTSLVNAPQLPAKSLALECYFTMFSGCTSLVNAPALPATTLAQYCYFNMFYGCTSLVNAPELPATTMVQQCYQQMFYNCTSLVNAPELPSKSLAKSCYNSMFQGCTNLANAPELPAEALEDSCYNQIFYGCAKIKYIKAMFITTPSYTYTSNWVNGVAATGTFVKNSAASWDVRGVHGIPTGWNVQTASS